MFLRTDGASLTVAGHAVRDIRLSGFRALDAITVAVRDEAWGTYPIDVRVTSATATTATLHGTHGDVFEWTGTIELSPAEVRFSLRGTVLRDVESRRIGVCLLHPLALAGRDFRTDNGPGTFGIAVDPRPPASGFRTLSYDIGVPVDIDLGGEQFEMEDHRNWSDPGWKSYSPPLDGGGPRRFRAGEQIRQTVTLRGRLTVVPHIDAYARTSATLVAASGPGLREAAAALARRGDVTRVSVFDPSTHTTAPGTVTAVRQVLRDLGCTAAVGGGSRAHLAELNRLDFRPDDWDFVTFPITAQAHHHDTASVLATVRAQPYMIEQASRIAPGLPVVVAPLAFRPRIGANSPGAPSDPADPRELSPVGEAWLTGSVIALRRAAALEVLFDGPLPRRLRELRGRPFIEVPTGNPDVVAATVPGEATFAVNLGASEASLFGSPLPGHAASVLAAALPEEEGRS